MVIKLEDGQYPCSAVVSIKDGKAEVIFDKSFGLKDGDEIPLKNQPEGSAIRMRKGSLIPENETAFI